MKLLAGTAQYLVLIIMSRDVQRTVRQSLSLPPEERLHSESGAFAPPQDIYHCTSVPCSLNENNKHRGKIRKPKLPLQVREVIAETKKVQEIKREIMCQRFDTDSCQHESGGSFLSRIHLK